MDAEIPKQKEAVMTTTQKLTKAEQQNVVATLQGVEVLEGPHLLPVILRSIKTGDYEKPEIEFGLANIKPGDRIMEMGTGAGIVGSVLLKQVDNVTLQSYEANPDLIPHIRNLYEHNGLNDCATVSNNIVVTGNNQPDAISFDIHDNFLGSQRSETNTKDKARTVSVETKHYDAISREYPHNVLIMDIEGNELEFLEGADLSSVELIVLELHPKIYGWKGHQRIVTSLSKKGFALDETTSHGQVASFKKKNRLKLRPDYSRIGTGKAPQLVYNIDPSVPLADEIITVDQAVLAKTPRSEGYRFAAAVFDKDKNPVPEAVCWITHRQSATSPRPHPRRNRIKDLPGTWMFGGRFNPSFGHFLTESISRIWALDHIDQPIEGVLFFPTYNDYKEDADKLFAQLSEILDTPINYKIVDQFYRVDKLIIPPQGNGTGRLMASSPEMRSYVATHLRTDFNKKKAKKLYISRSGSFGKLGRSFLGERILEGLLEDEGYTIFHPQDHSWEDQLAHYQSATHILGPDGSPFHLVNMTGNTKLNVGVIQRRPGHDANQMVNQGAHYGLANVHYLNHLGRLWSSAGDRRAAWKLLSEIQFGPLCNELKALRFIKKKTKWQNLTDAELTATLQEHADVAQADQRPVTSVSDTLSQYPRLVDAAKPQAFMA